MAQLNQFFDASALRSSTVAEPTPREIMDRVPAAAPMMTPIPPKTPPVRPSLAVVPPPKPAFSYERLFRILLRHPQKTDRYDPLIVKYSQRYGLDPRLIKAIIAAESEFTPSALSPKGAVGLMQVMPDTARMVVNVPWRNGLENPETNIAAGVGYLMGLFQAAWKRFKLKGVSYFKAPPWLIQRIIAAYNAGPRFLFRKHFYRETRDYVGKVMRFYQSKVTDIRRPPVQIKPHPSFIEQTGSFLKPALRKYLLEIPLL